MWQPLGFLSNLERVSDEIRIGCHIRKVLHEKLVLLSDDDFHLIPDEESFVDLYLYLLELPEFEITNFPHLISRLLTTYMTYSTHKTIGKNILSSKLVPFMNNPSLSFTDKLLLVCTLVTEYLDEKDYYMSTNSFPDFKVFLDAFFEYYAKEFENQSKQEVQNYLIRFPNPATVEFFEENIVPRLANLK